MSAADELTDAFGELQAEFNESAVVNGATVPIVRGVLVELGEAVELGGVIYTQALSLYYAIAGNPAPAVEQVVTFGGLTYRIWQYGQSIALWRVDLLQITHP
jgi:hypothetical protein